MTTALTNLPGVVVSVTSTAPQSSPPTDTGVAFFLGLALAGPIDKAVAIHSMADFLNMFGARDTQSLLYDACDVAFRSGASTIYVGRDSGPNPTNDTVTLKDATAADSLTVSSLGPTDTGWKVAVTAGTAGGTYVLTVTDASGGTVTKSPDLTTLADAVAWAADNTFISVTVVGDAVPAVVAATPLAGGSDDRANIDDTDVTGRQTQFTTLFPKLLGPGQLAYPGNTSVNTHVAVANTAANTNRVALLDMPDTSDAATLVAQRESFLGNADLESLAETFVAHLADWEIVPGVVSGTKRTVPPSPFWAGLISVNDALTGNPNIPAAGAAGVLTYALARTQPEWTDVDRNTLNGNNVNVVRNVFGTYRVYGYRSGANPNDDASNAWVEFSNVRMRMRIINDLDILGEGYVFAQLDGRGVTIASFNGAVSGRMQTYWTLGALYGDTAADAYTVVTDPPINTPATAAAQQLNVMIGAKFSPFAEKVYFGFTKTAITEAVA